MTTISFLLIALGLTIWIVGTGIMTGLDRISIHLEIIAQGVQELRALEEERHIS